MPAPQAVLDLVRRFTGNEADSRSPEYKEAQLRQEFINPFFEYLGWDMANRQGYTSALERLIRGHPGPPFWPHRRWKHPPKAKAEPAETKAA